MAANLSVSLQHSQGINHYISPAAIKDSQSPANDNWLMLAHDLRNPLIAMQRVLEIAIIDSNSDKTQDLLAQAHTNCDLLLDMLTDVLDSHRSRGYQENIAESPASPAVIIDKGIGLLQTLAAEKQISFRAQVPPDAPMVAADERSIIRVLTNLLHNAVKFSDIGGIIEIIVEAVSEDCLIFSVKDQGKGIPPHEAEKIFGMQYQCGPSHDPNNSGYGWGLYYCKTTLASLGGDIWVEPSAEATGEGTVISFAVPARRAPQPGGAEPCHYPVYRSA
jgi:signal transduction histidine kinase